MRSFFLIIAFITSSCASTFVPNFSLLRDYSFELQKQEPYTIPYYSLYEKNNKVLLYIAADHTSDTESLTFKLITRAVENFKPEIVIIEGVPTGKISDKYIEYVKRCPKKSFRNCGEPSFAAYQAIERNIALEGGEPSDNDILNYITQQGYSKEDLAYFYLLRISIQWKRQKRINSKNYEEELSKFIPIIEKRFNSRVSISFNGYINWYLENSGNSFDLSILKNNDVAPIKNGIFSQKISHTVGIARERNILSVLSASLNNHNRVLIIYGGGHFVKSKGILEEMLGIASIVSNNPDSIK